MRTHIIEATNGPNNWGKFLISQFTADEWLRRSEVDTETQTPLLQQIGWNPDNGHALVLDLQTGEGAVFRLGGLAGADLVKHRIWVCPLFEPFLMWLYAHWREHHEAGDASWWQSLPLHVDLPNAPFAMRGHRRPGPPEAALTDANALLGAARSVLARYEGQDGAISYERVVRDFSFLALKVF